MKPSKSSILPVKVVEDALQAFKQKVVNGNDINTSVIAMIKDKCSKRTKPAKKYKAIWVLLDGGSDGDLIFPQEGENSIIPLKDVSHLIDGKCQVAHLQLRMWATSK